MSVILLGRLREPYLMYSQDQTRISSHPIPKAKEIWDYDEENEDQHNDTSLAEVDNAV
jgi:hypothetical protein